MKRDCGTVKKGENSEKGGILHCAEVNLGKKCGAIGVVFILLCHFVPRKEVTLVVQDGHPSSGQV